MVISGTTFLHPIPTAHLHFLLDLCKTRGHILGRLAEEITAASDYAFSIHVCKGDLHELRPRCLKA